MLTTITTFSGKTFGLVTIPTTPGMANAEIGMNDAVAMFASPFTGVQQTQSFPGGDSWDATVTLPPMYRATAWPWEAFLAELRGKLNVFQLSDPRVKSPIGSGAGSPKVSTSGSNNLPMTTSLVTRGWTPTTFRLLMPGDHFQVGYRLYRTCEQVNSDASGNATITVWPSLRETPPDGTPLVLAKPAGLFRLADNRRAIHWSPSQLTAITLKCVEAR
jgi:hypothetical protein